MKLELKHLVHYLPYGLKVSQPRFGKIESYLLYGIKYLEYTKEWTVFIDDSRHGDYQNVYLKGIKPILHPLSDLVKEIEVNGERFVPIEWFEEKYYTLDLHKQCERLLEEDGYNWINQCDYMLVQQLVEWHFDVFKLIPEELAIDINILNKTS